MFDVAQEVAKGGQGQKIVVTEQINVACRGAGDSLIPMIMNCIGICVLRVVWIWVAVPIVPTLSTALMSYPVTWIITALLFGVYYYKGGWMKRRMKQMKSIQK